jgi:GNAT superfamily N-acetyltransferase
VLNLGSEVAEQSKSLFARYTEERGFRKVIERSYGFIVYEFIGEVVFIAELYVVPELRSKGLAKELVELVRPLALERGCKRVMCTSDARSEVSDLAFKAILAMGMKPYQSDGQLVYFMKEL